MPRIGLGRLACVIACAMITASILTGIPATGAEGVAKADDSRGAMLGDDQRETAVWTVLAYIVADNDLDFCLAEDLQELKEGGSSDSVNVLMLVDRFEEPAYLYRIENNEMVVLESLGEVDMGDPALLTWFVEYADTDFPAEHRLLFFWDHGAPTAGVGVDTTLEGNEPGESWSWLTHHEVVEALEGYHMDIIAYDECSIGQIETIYEYVARGLSVDYVIASESYIGYRGFVYDEIVLRLVADPEMAALELCEVIVEEFTNLFTQAPYMAEILTTQSIFDMSEIAPLAEAVSALANTLADDIDSYRLMIGEAQMAALMPWGTRGESWIDMPSFVKYVMENVEDSDPAHADCAAVLDAYGEAMLGMGVAKNTELHGYEGMGITFPASHSSYSIAYADSEWGGFNTYMTYEFPNMGWWDFLQTYWGMT
ncbi:MAG: hypothetical protein JSV90_06480 [Methanobacteriota archaeon]|nr:MAG: hypothetical protein JSV90_06480 [Euryarchaeota archaeon]